MNEYLQQPPLFWCEDDDEIDGSILLHYHSSRGTLLCPLVEGSIEELSYRQFHIQVKLVELSLQGDCCTHKNTKREYTTWRITAIDPNQRYKLSPKHLHQVHDESKIGSDIDQFQKHLNLHQDRNNTRFVVKCPFSGKSFKTSSKMLQQHKPFNLSINTHDDTNSQQTYSQLQLSEKIQLSIPVSPNVGSSTTKTLIQFLDQKRQSVSFGNHNSQSIIDLIKNKNTIQKKGNIVEEELFSRHDITQEEQQIKNSIMSSPSLTSTSKKRTFGTMLYNGLIQPISNVLTIFIEPILYMYRGSINNHINNDSSNCKIAMSSLFTKVDFSEIDAVQQEILSNVKRNKRRKTTHEMLSTHCKDESVTNMTKFILNDITGFNMTTLQSVFPFHVLVDESFMIRQVGNKLLPLLQSAHKRNVQGSSSDLMSSSIHYSDHMNANISLLHLHMTSVFEFARPVIGTDWNWKTLHKFEDQNFTIIPNKSLFASPKSCSIQRRVSLQESAICKNSLRFICSMIKTDNEGMVLFHLIPDVKNVKELQKVGLTLTDLPLHTSQRDAIFLGEYMEQEVNHAHKLDKISKQLEYEKKLSNTLLYNMLPPNIADDLRCGKTIEPKHYDNVTLFFSGMRRQCNILD